MNFFSLLTKASILKDMPFVCAFGFAILKDILDIAFIGVIPGIGTVLTLICSIAIGMMMLLSGMGNKQSAGLGVVFNKWGMLLAGTMAESFLPGFNFLPIETATVLAIYTMVLAGRANADK